MGFTLPLTIFNRSEYHTLCFSNQISAHLIQGPNLEYLTRLKIEIAEIKLSQRVEITNNEAQMKKLMIIRRGC